MPSKPLHFTEIEKGVWRETDILSRTFTYWIIREKRAAYRLYFASTSGHDYLSRQIDPVEFGKRVPAPYRSYVLAYRAAMKDREHGGTR